MNFLRNLSLVLNIFVRTRGARPLTSLIMPSNTRTTAFVPVRSMLGTGGVREGIEEEQNGEGFNKRKFKYQIA